MKLKKIKTFNFKNFFIFFIILFILSIFFYYIPLFQKFELKLLDLKYQLRPKIKIHPDVGFIDFDDASIELCGPWVWPRSRQVVLAKTLSFYKTRIAGYDVFFSEPSKIIFDVNKLKNFLTNLNNQLLSLSNRNDINKINELVKEEIEKAFKDEDNEFAAALKEANLFYLGSFMVSPSSTSTAGLIGVQKETEEIKKRFSEDKRKVIEYLKSKSIKADELLRTNLYKSVDIVVPIEKFTASVCGVGFAQIIKDLDASVRLFPISLYYDDYAFLALSFMMSLDLLGINLQDIKIKPGEYIELPPVQLFNSNKKEKIRIPIDEHCQMLVNWAGAFNEAYLHISYKTISEYYAYIIAKQLIKKYEPKIENYNFIKNILKNEILSEELVEKESVDEIVKSIVISYILSNYLDNNNEIKPEIKEKLLSEISEEKLNVIKNQIILCNYFEKNIKTKSGYNEILNDLKLEDNIYLRESYKNVEWFAKNRNITEAKPYYFPPPVKVNQNGHYIDFSPVDLQNKIFMIGLTGAGTIDLNPMPFEQATPMVALHTNAINMFLTGQYLYFPDKYWQYLAPFFAVFITVLITLLFSPVIAFFSSLVIILILWFLSYNYFWLYKNTWVYSFVPFFSVLVSYLTILIYKFILALKEKKKVRSIFSTMVSPAVLKLMEENPDRFSLTGERKEATMMFSLVVNFAKIIKSSNPDELSSILSIYLTPTSEIIMDYGGYIDKYEGHIIMADFGVPLDDKDHFWKCAYSAIEQQLDIRSFQKYVKIRFGIDVYTATGINCGYVSAGNMGSEKKFQYTVMGDAVNVAARFMPANFIYNSRILTGNETYEKIKDYIHSRHIDKLLLKGKTRPTDLYEIQGWRSDVYLKLLENKDVPESFFTRISKAPPEKIIGYINFWKEKYEDTNNELAKEIYEFFLKFKEETLERILLGNQFEFLKYHKETNLLIQEIEKIYLKEVKRFIFKADNYNDLIDKWILYVDEKLEEFKKFYHHNMSSINSMQFADIETRLSVLKNKLELSKNKFVYYEGIEEEIKNIFEQLKEFLMKLENFSIEEIRKKILELKMKYDEAAKNFYKSQIKPENKKYLLMMSEVGTITERIRKNNELYELALIEYWKRNWDGAIELFTKAKEIRPDDGPTNALLERTKNYKISPPPDNWQGEFIQTKK
ncbi:MAG TPA: CHASE2 domain-containing protein [bacterium]|nr:CHASE2 domain-containing protein [bacterium]HOL48642.1 CHASE2 domain-containing protein [bacterium]HPQ19598.1 CHASE2 domain-containing protein [bacterium]